MELSYAVVIEFGFRVKIARGLANLRVYIAGFGTEINTFSPIPTDMSLFDEVGVFRGDGSLRWHESGNENYIAPILEVWRKEADRKGDTVTEGLCACAQPAGIIPGPVYETLRDELLVHLEDNKDQDMVLLCLHGAMVAEGYEDCEGDLLSRVRRLIGDDVVVGVHLDLHVNLTDAMLEHADILICHKEYPHVDGAERAMEIYALCEQTVSSAIRPVMRYFETRLVGLFPTTSEPMRNYVDSMTAAQTGEVLSVSFAHGFPWSDIDHSGARVWVIANQDESLAQETANRFGRRVYELRSELMPDLIGVEEAIDRLQSGSAETPVVIADVSDNAGGGAPSDSTFVLQSMIDREIGNIALGCFYDPAVLTACVDAGVGSVLDISIGGKHGSVSGQPVELEVTIRGIEKDHRQVSYEELVCPLGTSVWVEAEGGVHLVLTSIRSQTYSPDAFTGLGLALENRRAVVVKSSQHFYAKFHEMAGEVIYVHSPGAMPMDFANIRYRSRRAGFWPQTPGPLDE